MPSRRREPATSSRQIRQAASHQAPAIAAMHVRSWRAAYGESFPDGFVDSLEAHAGQSWWERVLVDPRLVVMAASVDGRLAGVCVVAPAEDDDPPPGAGEVIALYVDPAMWRRGHGRALLDASTARLRARGFSRAVLWVLERNDPARRFYEAAGWRADGAARPADLFGTGAREVRYRLPL